MKSQCIKAPKKFGEDIRQACLKKKTLNTDLEIDKDSDYIYIPIKSKLKDKALEKEFQIKYSDYDFAVLEKVPESYKDVINVPKEVMELLPTSFDIVGNIAVIKIKPDIEKYKDKIGIAIMKANKNVATVAMDKGVIGDFRVRDLEIIAGRNITETRHTEYGVEIQIDLAKVYFSPRLAQERYRIAGLVKDGEVIIDMFAGAGPFSLMIAKHAKPQKIYSIDLNPDAIEFLNKNIGGDHINVIEPVFGDAKYVTTTLEPADRLIMNLPFNAFDFLEEAINAAKESAMIHYFEIVEDDQIDARVKEITDKGKDMGISLLISEVRKIKSYSPTQTHIGLDIHVSK